MKPGTSLYGQVPRPIKGVYLTPPAKGLTFKEKLKKDHKSTVTNKGDSIHAPPATNTKRNTHNCTNKQTFTTTAQPPSLLPMMRGIPNDRVSCWWIATIQAIKPFIPQAKSTNSKFQGSDVFLWRNLVKPFHTLEVDTSAPIPFHIVQPVIKESSLQMNINCMSSRMQ